MSTSHADTLPPVLPLGTPAKEWANDTHNLLGHTQSTNPPITDETQPSTQTSHTLPIIPVNVPEAAAQNAKQVDAPVSAGQAHLTPTASTREPLVKPVSEVAGESPLSATDRRTVIQPEHTALNPVANQPAGAAQSAFEHPGMSREESKASVASTSLDIPGSWSKEWPASNANQTYNDAAAALSAAGQKIQEGVANLTSQAADRYKASGPVGTPAHPSTTTTSDLTQYAQSLLTGAQQTVGGLVETARGAVGQSTKETETETAPHVAGLIGPPEHASTPNATTPSTDFPSNYAPKGLGTGGAMINTEPPSGAIHPATSDHNTSQVSHKQTAPSGPSPVDGLMPGQTRANHETTHTGNYAYTDLPTSAGNTLDPHADGKGVLDHARDAVAGLSNRVTSATSGGEGPGGVGYLQQAMAAVGLGGAAAGAAAVSEDREKEKHQPAPTTAEPTPAPTSGVTSFDPKENILAHPNLRSSVHGPDDDVQAVLSGKASGLDENDSRREGGDVDNFNKAATKERDFASNAGATPSQTPVQTKPKDSGVAVSEPPRASEHQTSPVQTTSNVYPKAAVATQPKTGYEDHAAAAKEDKPVTTTSNVHDKTPIATSFATSVNNTADKPKPTVATHTSDQAPAEHYRDSTTATSASTNTSSSTPSSPSKGHKRGPSLKDKIKGEMKVLTGKLSRNQDKVEEGKALKSGGGLTSPGPTSVHQ